jgi:hypothetical protein
VVKNKRIMKTKLFLLFIGLTLLLTSCENSDKDIDFGNSLLYMPQAIMQSGGTNANYIVPVNLENISDTIIYVGIYRSGLETLREVSVDLRINKDTLQSAIAIANTSGAPQAYDIYKTAKLLPANYYKIPDKIGLKTGERESVEQLVLNRKMLSEDGFFQSTGNRYILPVYITNPTRYELNEGLSLTMFVFEFVKPNIVEP